MLPSTTVNECPSGNPAMKVTGRGTSLDCCRRSGHRMRDRDARLPISRIKSSWTAVRTDLAVVQLYCVWRSKNVGTHRLTRAQGKPMLSDTWTEEIHGLNEHAISF